VLLYALQLIGVAVFAASGALAAARKDMDIFGVAMVAIATALGGGTIRDVLLDRHPVFWIGDPIYLFVTLVGAALTILYGTYRKPPDNALAVADALGLGLFTILGVEIAEQAGADGAISVLMGMITGVAGGIIRDVLSAQVPLIFRKGELYATAAIAGGCAYLLLTALDVPRAAASLVAMGAIVALRLGAILWQWHLPVFPVKD
jgi:uncharacterized membrane protein YeiH